MTVLREVRRQLAEDLEELLDGAITDAEFENRYERLAAKLRKMGVDFEEDRVVPMVKAQVWQVFEGPEPWKRDAQHPIHPSTEVMFRKLILFLRSDLEYEWPFARYPSFEEQCRGLLMNLLTLGGEARRRGREFSAAGDVEVWPFLRAVDYERELRRQP